MRAAAHNAVPAFYICDDTEMDDAMELIRFKLRF